MTTEDDVAGLFARLLAEARAGSLDALGRLLEEFRPYLLQVANDELDSDLKGKEGPSDLVQQSFMEAAQAFGRFVGDGPNDLRLWLREILSNNIKDLRERYQTRKRQVSRETRQNELSGSNAGGEKADPGSSPSEQVMSRELGLALDEALAKLSPEQRELIRLRQKEGRSFVEIAKLLGASEDALQKRWARAVEELRAMMDASGRGG